MFITFEGIDGCGKSTQAKMLLDWIKGRFYTKKAILTREPGGWQGGEIFRSVVLDGALKHPWSEAFLFMLDRGEHVSRVIQPALDDGSAVLCERYHDSTLAYQAWGRGLSADVFEVLASAVKFPVPHTTILFDIPVSVALDRASKRGRLDAFENEGARFMERVRGGYLALAAKEPKRWMIIDASTDTIADIHMKTIDLLTQRGVFDEW